ncbi:phage antirepressor [Negativibacillus massiliensis]|uniref:phage antirepressor n=1 Tax=Negativibacillus massiliensis TaxID=1871035 RepID=UPI0039A1CE9D
MTDLQIFNSPEFGAIRTIEKDGEPWFVGKDVAAALGYKEPTKAAREKVDDDDKGVSKIDTPSGIQEMTIINESGLYSLVLSSKLPTAKKFKRWVTNEVIPSIRKHGAYMTPETLEKVLLSPDTLMQLAQNLKDEQEKRKALEAQIESQKPAVLFTGAVETSKTSILIGELAKMLKQNGINIGQNRLFAWMREKGYLIKRKGTDYNMPTQRSMDMGLFEIKETTINNPDGSIKISKTPKVTGKGQVYFINLFLNKEEL